jgi:hypothetical protein
MKAIRIIYKFLMFVITGVILWVNISLYAEVHTKEEKKNDIIFQLNFLETALKKDDLDNKMQQIFPEGFVFTNVLYGLSWCELGMAGVHDSIKQRAIAEAKYAFDQINTEAAKSIFSLSIEPTYGIFYLGWSNYLLSKIITLDSTSSNILYYEEIYKNQSAIIANEIQKSATPFLQSYKEQAWPADMCVAMASLANYKNRYDNRYDTLISLWITAVKSRVDPYTKLIPHKVNAENGTVIEGARGCSISLIIRLLAEIDTNFAAQQYKHYTKKFVTTTFGLPSVSEYPAGKKGLGDIDSGPVIFGVGFAGTIVSMGTFAIMGDTELAEKQYKTIHAFGFSSTNAASKKYIFGKLPIADAFIAWGRSSGLKYHNDVITFTTNWRLTFHIISLVTIIILWLIPRLGTIKKAFIRKKPTL